MKAKRIILGLLFFLFISAHPAFAQELTITTTPVLTPTVTPTYQLPYPGVLPGQPFYFLKTMRDKFWGVLISNSLKKAEFDLLQTDKNFAAAEILFKKKSDTSLILTTLTDGRGYFEDALKKSAEANKQGMDASDLLKRMQVANIRHQSVVFDMTHTNNKDDQKKYYSELEKVKQLGRKTSQFITH